MQKWVKQASGMFLASTMVFTLAACGSSSETSSSATASAGTGTKPAESAAAKETAKPAAGKKTKIEFWVPFTGPDAPFMKKIAEDFSKSQEKYDVHFNNSNGTDYYNKFTVALTSGKDLPDAMVMHIDNVPVYKDKLLPLDDIAAKVGIVKENYQQAPVKNTTLDGKWYAFPLDIHPLLMYYNKDLFKAAGIDHPPTNKDEFLADVKKMTDESKKQYGYMVVPNGQWWPFGTLLSQFGGKYADDQNNPTFNSDAGVQAVQFQKDLIDQKLSPANVEGGADETAFKQGKLGIIFAGPWMMDAWEQAKLNWGAAVLPQIGPNKAAWAGSHTLVIPNTTKDADKLDGIAAFYKYIAENGIDWAKSGQAPASKKVTDSAEFQQLTKQQTEIIKEFDYVYFPPQVPNFGANINELWVQVNNVLTGKQKDIKAALDSAAAKYKQAASK